jgi:hypothetical protein
MLFRKISERLSAFGGKRKNLSGIRKKKVLRR